MLYCFVVTRLQWNNRGTIFMYTSIDASDADIAISTVCSLLWYLSEKLHTYAPTCLSHTRARNRCRWILVHWLCRSEMIGERVVPSEWFSDCYGGKGEVGRFERSNRSHKRHIEEVYGFERSFMNFFCIRDLVGGARSRLPVRTVVFFIRKWLIENVSSNIRHKDLFFVTFVNDWPNFLVITFELLRKFVNYI